MKYKRLRFIREMIQERNQKELDLELEALSVLDDEKELARQINECFAINPQNALCLIDDFLEVNTKPILQAEVETRGMHTEASILETRLSVLQTKKAETSRIINQFRIRHNHELGMIMSDLLRLRWEQLLKQQQNDNQADEQVQNAEKQYKQHKRSREFQAKTKAPKLKLKDQDKLKKMFREACKICHPDMVAEEVQEQAQQLFNELNNAYYYNDIDKIEEILLMLKSGKIHLGRKNQTLEQHQRLKNYISTLRKDIYILQSEISELQQSGAYLSIKQIDDWDVYFQGLKAKFTQERDALKELLNNGS